MIRSAVNGKVMSKLRNSIYKLLTGFLLCSISLMSMPAWAQNGEQTVEEGNSVPVWLASLSASLAAGIVKQSIEKGGAERAEEMLKLFLKGTIGTVYEDMGSQLKNPDARLAQNLNFLAAVNTGQTNTTKKITDNFFKVADKLNKEKGRIKKLLRFPLQLPILVLGNHSKLVNNRFYGYGDTKGGERWIRK